MNKTDLRILELFVLNQISTRRRGVKGLPRLRILWSMVFGFHFETNSSWKSLQPDASGSRSYRTSASAIRDPWSSAPFRIYVGGDKQNQGACGWNGEQCHALMISRSRTGLSARCHCSIEMDLVITNRKFQTSPVEFLRPFSPCVALLKSLCFCAPGARGLLGRR